MSMSNIVINYSKILEVLSSLHIENHTKASVCRSKKMNSLEVIALSLTAEYLLIDSENNLFEKIDKDTIANLLERSQFNKRPKALLGFNELVRQKLAVWTCN